MEYEIENESSEEGTLAEFVWMEDGAEIEVPVAPVVRVERASRLGTVPGLDEDELLSEAELARWVEWQMWGPILALPQRRASWGIRPDTDESGRVDWGAFGTVDFARIAPEFDKARYKADRLREKLADTLDTLAMVKRRLPAAGFLALKYLQMDILQREHVVNDDVLAVLRLQQRITQLRDEIRTLRQHSAERRQRGPRTMAALVRA